MAKVKPLFLQREISTTITLLLGIIGNTIVILLILWWLFINRSVIQQEWFYLIPTFFAGLFFADWFSGLVHWFTDTWGTEKHSYMYRVFSIAREHHVLPRNIVGYDIIDLVAYSSYPACVVLGPFAVAIMLFAPLSSFVYCVLVVFAMVCTLMYLGSHFHIMGHTKSKSLIIRSLQKIHFLCTPQYHGLHHRGDHNQRYAVLNGWSNIICDKIGFWRMLESLVTKLTGAIPRENDFEWMRRYGKRK